MVSKKESLKEKIHLTQRKKMKSLLAQIFAACSKYLIMLDIGMGVSYATIAIPALLSNKQGLSLTQDESSWYASLVYMWQPVGSMATVILSNMGRKRSMFYLQLPFFVGWLLPFFATTVWELYLASSIMGLSIGFMQAPIATYIGEVTEPKYRGWMASIAYFCFTLGGVVIYFIDVLIGNYRKTAICASVMPFLTALVLYLIPESPVWLISKGRNEEAKQALKWLRGWASDEDIEQEYRSMVFFNSDKFSGVSETIGANSPVKTVTGVYTKGPEESTQGNSIKDDKNQMSFMRYCMQPEMYKPMIMTLIFMYISNGTGVGAFKSYLIIILQRFEVTMDEYQVNLYVSCFGLIGNIICVIVLPLVKKRPLTFTSVGLTMVGMFALGIYGILCQNLNMPWIPILLLTEIFLATNLAIGHIPWIVISEIFPLRGRTFATGLLAGVGNALQFVGTKMFYTYVSWFTVGGVFIMYAVTYLLGLIYLYFFLVETEGRTLNDIVDHFRNNKSARRSTSVTEAV